MKNPLNFFKDKAQAFRVALMAGKLRELVDFKRAEQPKKPKSNKTPYEWGDIGLSEVSTEIKKDHGSIINRRERKRLAREAGEPLARYYNN